MLRPSLPSENNFASDLLTVTQSAAVAVAEFIGRGDAKAADAAAVKAMRDGFEKTSFCSVIVIGEGEKDEAPMLYTGETFCAHERSGGGTSCEEKNRFDIAVDPLECTDSVANGRPNAITVIVAGEHGSLFHAPDVYMDKVAVGPGVAKAMLPAMEEYLAKEMDVETFLTHLAKALKKPLFDITTLVLDRPRHVDLIADIRKAGARVKLITDGDVAGALAPSLEGSDIDCLLGIGASTEAVLAAGGLKALGGEIVVRFAPKDEKQQARIADFGFTDLAKIYTTDDLAKGDDIFFAATGVVDGPLLQGVVKEGKKATTYSVLMSAKSREVRYIETHH